MTEWIDGCEAATPCEPEKKQAPLDADAMRKSAFHQCGSWCIYNLAKRNKTGWEFTGSCFFPFGGASDRSSPCLAGVRPDISLG